MRVPGVRGEIIDVKPFSREAGTEAPAGVSQMVRVAIAQKRKISVGDKMAGRHGNEGVISQCCPPRICPSCRTGAGVGRHYPQRVKGYASPYEYGCDILKSPGWAAMAWGYKVAAPLCSTAQAKKPWGPTAGEGGCTHPTGIGTVRRSHRRAVRQPCDGGPDIYAEARHLVEDRDSRTVEPDRTAWYPATVGRQGTVWRSKVWRDGSVGRSRLTAQHIPTGNTLQ